MRFFPVRLLDEIFNAASAVAIGVPLVVGYVPASDRDVNVTNYGSIEDIITAERKGRVLGTSGYNLVFSPDPADIWSERYQEFCTAQKIEACKPNDEPVTLELTQDLYDVLHAVNIGYNTAIVSADDIDIYGVHDLWRLPDFNNYKGDCEDKSIAKRQHLIAEGIAAGSLSILIVDSEDFQGKYLHAVLAVRTDKGMLILDNLSSDIRHWDETGYTLISAQSHETPSKFYNGFMVSASLTAPFDMTSSSLRVAMPRPKPGQ